DNSARTFVVVIDATRQKLMLIFASSALSYRIGRTGQPNASKISRYRAGRGRAGSAQPIIKRSGLRARSTARPKTKVSTWQKSRSCGTAVTERLKPGGNWESRTRIA